MKCICGYEKKEYYEGDNNDVLGDDEFIEISGGFTIDVDNYFKETRKVSLMACPKCGTVRMEA